MDGIVAIVLWVFLGIIVITIIVNQRGLNDAAAVGIVEKIISFVFLVPSSMLSAVSALQHKILALEKMNVQQRH